MAKKKFNLYLISVLLFMLALPVISIIIQSPICMNPITGNLSANGSCSGQSGYGYL